MSEPPVEPGAGDSTSEPADDAQPAPVEAKDGARPSTWRIVREGLVGGVIATAVMSLYRLPVFRALPPTAEFWAQYVQDGDPESFFPEAMALHVAYGAGAGAAFSLLFSVLVARVDADAHRRFGLLSGVVYGGLLSAFGSTVLLRALLDEDLDDEEALVFHVGHLVYGLSLGTWVTTRGSYGEVYD